MNRRMIIVLMVAALVAITLVCRQFDSQATPDQQKQAKDSPIYLQDAHLVRNNTEATKLLQQVEAAKKRAFEHGYHACCINPPCSWCLLHLGQCSCAVGVASHSYACRECHGGWEANEGKIPGKTKGDVRKMKTLTAGSKGQSAGQTAPEGGREEPTPSGTEGKSPGTEAQLLSLGEKIYNSN